MFCIPIPYLTVNSTQKPTQLEAIILYLVYLIASGLQSSVLVYLRGSHTRDELMPSLQHFILRPPASHQMKSLTMYCFELPALLSSNVYPFNLDPYYVRVVSKNLSVTFPVFLNDFIICWLIVLFLFIISHDCTWQVSY